MQAGPEDTGLGKESEDRVWWAGKTQSEPLNLSHPLLSQSLGHVRLFTTPCTVTRQALLTTGVSRQEYWSRLPFPSPGDLPDPGIEPRSHSSPALQVDSVPTEPPGKPSVTNGPIHFLTKSLKSKQSELGLLSPAIGPDMPITKAGISMDASLKPAQLEAFSLC